MWLRENVFFLSYHFVYSITLRGVLSFEPVFFRRGEAEIDIALAADLQRLAALETVEALHGKFPSARVGENPV